MLYFHWDFRSVNSNRGTKYHSSVEKHNLTNGLLELKSF